MFKRTFSKEFESTVPEQITELLMTFRGNKDLIYPISEIDFKSNPEYNIPEYEGFANNIDYIISKNTTNHKFSEIDLNQKYVQDTLLEAGYDYFDMTDCRYFVVNNIDLLRYLWIENELSFIGFYTINNKITDIILLSELIESWSLAIISYFE